MARYYYERYNVTSSTTYTWRYYDADEKYSEGGWSSQELVSNSASSYSGGSGYSFNTATGGFLTTGSRTIKPGDSGYAYHSLNAFLYRYFFSSTSGSTTLYRQVKTYVQSGYTQGTYRGITHGRSYSYRTNNARNSDGYWWVRGSSSTSYSRGSYIDTIIAEDDTYPDNGRSGSYWYIKRQRAFPEFDVREGGALYKSQDGWVRVEGVQKTIQQIWVRDDGTLKEI